MTAPCGIFSTKTKYLVSITLVCSISFASGCRRSTNSNRNANGNAATGQVTGEQALREAQSLIEKGRELYKNDQDEQAAQAFEQAVRLQPDMAEAHLRLGMDLRSAGKERRG